MVLSPQRIPQASPSFWWGYEFEDDGYPEDVDFNPALEFVCGRGDVVPQIDQGVEGLKIGDQRFIQCDEKNPLFGFPVLFVDHFFKINATVIFPLL